MKGILKSTVLCPRHPQRHKTVSFPAGTALCTNVHEADEWDRTPVAATRKLSYQDILELKEMQIALLKNTPAFPQLLSTVPVGLVPLLPPEQPTKLEKFSPSAFEKVDEVGSSSLVGETPTSDPVPSPPIPIPIASQSVTPTRKFYLPIVPLQDPSTTQTRAVRMSPPLPPSPARSCSPASSISSSPPFTSPLSGRSSPFRHSNSPSSSPSSYSPIATYRTPIPRLPTPTRNAESIALHQSVSDPVSASPYSSSSFPSHRFILPPSFLGIYGSHNTFRDILPPTPFFAPYSVASTRSSIYSSRITPPSPGPTRRLGS